MNDVINHTALRILFKNSTTLRVQAVIRGETVNFRVVGMGSKLCGTVLDTGEFIEDVRPEWVTRIHAVDHS